MPYVTVWIDPEDGGDCDKCDEAREAAIHAQDLAKEGDMLGVIRALSVIAESEDARKERLRETEARELYKAWLKVPAPRPDFLTYAHTRRKHTAA